MSRVRPTTVLLLAAILAFLAAWLAPVFSAPDPSTLSTAAPANVTYPGYRVFWTVLGLLWSPEGPEDWKDALTFTLYVASSLTNLVFVAALGALLAGWLRALPPLQWLVLGSGVLNLYWFFEMKHLQIGYYLWIAAFFLLFVAMARRSGA
ncbi:MAG: hypothetical protein ACRET4_17935 [Steroidobacteraceae bacterium]